MMATSDNVRTALKTLVDIYDKEDRAIRERQIRTWRRLKMFWEGFQRAWYSEVAHDWRIWDETTVDTSDQSYYDKPVNIFRAYLESIVAALSVTVPPVQCFPDDADNPLDLSTAKAGDKIAQLIYKHNDAILLWIHALFIYCTEGMVACYSYPREDESYGTYQKKEYEDQEETHQYAKCPECGFTIQDTLVGRQQANPQDEERMEDLEDKYMPEDEDVKTQAAIERDVCPACLKMVDPVITQEPFVVTRLIGITNEPKTRVCLEAYGGLYVKVPNYAKKQSDCPYLIFAYETNFVNAIEKYGELDGKRLRQKIKASTGPKDPYEEWGRLNPQYQGEYPQNVVTVRNAWLRPCSFNALDDEDMIKTLKRKYPNGCKVVFVNDEFAEACNESLDDCWTLTQNPLADFIHHDPLGLLLTSIQEITNDLIALTVQTIEHGIPQTFADPGVLDFDAYRQMETVPGGVYEAKPKTGQRVGDGFYEVKTATLSQEVLPFFQQLQSLGQLVSGALPSLFGGQMQEGSGTASEYSMSRAQALQRLQNTWKMFTIWWKQIFGKAVPMYIKEVQEDEKDVQRDDNGNFINVFIRKAELEGKIGKVELEANENLPITWNQQKDIVMQLLKAGVPEVLQILGAPENLPVIRNAIGLVDFYVPGEDDRTKQYDEIKQLLNSEPIPDPATGQEMPSVEIDVDYDNHAIEFEICRSWITGEAGRQAKIDNQNGYRNVLLHGKLHLNQMRQLQASQPSKGAAPPEKPNANDMSAAPITGEENVSTVH